MFSQSQSNKLFHKIRLNLSLSLYWFKETFVLFPITSLDNIYVNDKPISKSLFDCVWFFWAIPL